MRTDIAELMTNSRSGVIPIARIARLGVSEAILRPQIRSRDIGHPLPSGQTRFLRTTTSAELNITIGKDAKHRTVAVQSKPRSLRCMRESK